MFQHINRTLWMLAAAVTLTLSFSARPALADDTPAKAGTVKQMEVTQNTAGMARTAAGTRPQDPARRQSATSPWYVILVLMLFGGLGGFVDGLTANVSYKVSWGGRRWEIGSLGDVLVGMTAAIAIFTVASALFPDLKIEEFETDLKQFIRIVAVGVLSGYAGIRLLNPLTRKLAEQIATDKANEAVKAIKTQSVELTINVKDGDRKLANYDFQKDHLFAEEKYDDAAKLLDEPQKCYQAALGIDPVDTEALMGAAKVARRRAELAKLQDRDPDDYWKAAIKALDGITDRDKQSARAFYNKACYKNLMGRPSGEVLKDLKVAIDLSPALKDRARTDPDFATLKDKDADFNKMTGLVGKQ